MARTVPGGAIEPDAVSVVIPSLNVPDGERPTVSVCTPTYQGIDRLRRVAPRLLAALGPDDEWIVSVDGSTDGTVDFVASLSQTDPRVRAVVAAANGGRTTALNAACRRALKGVVLRLDDDILVEPDFLERHAQAHAAAVGPIGVVQPVTDLTEQGCEPGRWSSFVARNAAIDARQLIAGSGSLPPRSWGAVCSIPRDVGASLGWYDERFNAYGWEDVEFGYRIRLAGVSIVQCAGPPALHIAHATDFRRKFERGFEAGARMALFATIHGPEAVLVALGRDPREYAVPRRPAPGRKAARVAAGTEGTLARLAVLGEAGLSSMPSRRGYDYCVARWLNWAYARGWSAEVRRRALPPIPAPPSWRRTASPSWVDAWERIVAAMGESPSLSDRPAERAERAARRALARSAFLRTLERDVKPSSRRWREAAGAAYRASQQCLAQGAPGGPTQGRVDVLVVVDAATPSILGRGVGVAKAAARENLQAHLVCSSPAVAAATREAERGSGVSSIGEWQAAGGRAGRLRACLQCLAPAWRATHRYAQAVPLPLSARAQLVAESLLALSRRPPCQAVLASLQPSVVVSASEYFDVGAIMTLAAREAGVPFVTLQHGAINMLFAPFSADRYLVWNDAARDALLALDPTSEPRVSVVMEESPAGAGVRHAPQAPAELCRRLGVPPSTHLLGVFSQTHGAEFSAATHFTLAAQLDHLLAAHPHLALAIKRHPSEPCSLYESLLDGPHRARVIVAPMGLNAGAFAAACDAVCALRSTALRDAMAAGCPAIELESPDSLVRQPLAVLRTAITSLEATVTRILRDESFRRELLDRQRAALEDAHAGATVAGVLRSLCAERSRA